MCWFRRNGPHHTKDLVGGGAWDSGQARNGGPQLLVKANVEFRVVVVQEVAEGLVVDLHQAYAHGAFEVLGALVHDGVPARVDEDGGWRWSMRGVI